MDAFELRDATDARVQDTTEHILDRACTHESSYVQGVQRAGREGGMRIVTHAFVRPGRSHDFVNHLTCATPALVAAMVNVHGSVERVPVAKEVDGEKWRVACEQLRQKSCVV